VSISELLDLQESAYIGLTSSSEFPSEGGSPTFDAVPFRVAPGVQPDLNTFVIVLRQGEDDNAHYGRIVVGREINIKANPREMQQNEAFGMQRSDIRSSEHSYDLVRIMEIELLGELYSSETGLRISETRQLPQTGQEVYEIPAAQIPTLLNIPIPSLDGSGSDLGLRLGRIESGRQSVEFLLPNKAIARHMAVLGKTGVGKSYAAGVLIEELVTKNIPIVSFDVLGETEQTARELGGTHVVAGANEFRIPYSIIGLQEFLEFIPSLTPDQRDLVAPAYGQIFDTAINDLERGQPISVTYNDLYNAIRAIGTQITSRATNGAVERTIAALQRSNLLTERAVNWHNLLSTNPLTNIYLGALSQRQRNLVVGAAARILQRLRRLNSIPPFVLLLDEAHLFLPSGGESSLSTNVVRELIRTARHDSIGIVLLSQSPSSMDRQVLLTCNTRIIFALDPDDLRVVAGQLGDLPQETIDRIPRMSQGRAVFSSSADIMRHPVVVNIRQRERTTHAAETPDLAQAVAEWRHRRQG
jgi:uncharacterized protein